MSAAATAPRAGAATADLPIEGMTCGGCAAGSSGAWAGSTGSPRPQATRIRRLALAGLAVVALVAALALSPRLSQPADGAPPPAAHAAPGDGPPVAFHAAHQEQP